MNNVMLKNLMLVLFLLLAACSQGPTLDGTNRQTFEASMDMMENSVEGNDKIRFMLAIGIIAGEANRMNRDDPGAAMRRLIGGKTVRGVMSTASELGEKHFNSLDKSTQDQVKNIRGLEEMKKQLYK